MNSVNSPHLPLLATASLLLGGCLINAHGDRIIRRDDTRVDAFFESEEGLIDFQSTVRRRMTHGNRYLGRSEFFIPFIIEIDQDRILSRTAFYNDQVEFADLNGDGQLSDAEVTAYTSD